MGDSWRTVSRLEPADFYAGWLQQSQRNDIEVSASPVVARGREIRWIETVQYLAQQQVANVVECGPGKVLGSLTKRIDSNLLSATLHDAASLRDISARL